MSISLNLVIYQLSGDDLTEENARTETCVEIPPPLLSHIEKRYHLQKEVVYYDSAKDDYFEIDTFAKEDVLNIINELRAIFKNLIDHEHSLLNYNSDAPPVYPEFTEIRGLEILSGHNDIDPISAAIARLRILIRVIDVFTDMQMKHINDPGSVLKLG